MKLAVLVVALAALIAGAQAGYPLVGIALGDKFGENVAEYDQQLGRFQQVLRIYFSGDTIPTSLSALSVETFLQQGRSLVLSFKATAGGTQVPSAANVQAADDYFALVAKAGFASQIYFTPHHEPFPELSGSDFINKVYLPLAGVARKHGIKAGPTLQSYPYLRGTNIATYLPSDATTWDFLGIDTYPDSCPGQSDNGFLDKSGKPSDPLGCITPMITHAANLGKPWILAEFGVKDSESSDPNAATWIESWSKLPTDGSCLAITYFDAQDFVFSAATNLIPAYQKLYDSLTKQHGSTAGKATTAGGKSTVATSSAKASSASTGKSSTTGCVAPVATTDNFNSISSSWNIVSGYSADLAYFLSSLVKASSSGLVLSLSKSGCPAACGSNTLGAGFIQSVSATTTGEWSITAKTSSDANAIFYFQWMIQTPSREGVQVAIVGNQFIVQQYVKGSYKWIGKYTLAFNPSSAEYRYTISRTATSYTVTANGATIAQVTSGVPQAAGHLGLYMTATAAPSTTTVTTNVQSATYSTVGTCPGNEIDSPASSATTIALFGLCSLATVLALL